MNRNGLISSAILVAFLATACSPGKELRRADSAYRDADSESRAYIEQMRARQPQADVAPRDTVRVTTDQWVDPRPIRAVTRRLPAAIDCPVNFKPTISTGLLEFAQQISQDCRIAVRVTPDAIVAVNGGAGQGNAPAVAGAGAQIPGMPAGMPALPPLPSDVPMIQSLPMLGSQPGLLSGIDWSGPVSGLLDLVTARNGLSWRYSDTSNSISIFYLDTQTFRLDAFPTKTTMQSTIQSGTTATIGASGGSSSGGDSGGGIGGTSGSAQTTTISSSTALYEDIEATLKSFLTPSVGRIAVSQSTGSVTVTDTPEVLDRVATYLTAENATITKQIILHAKVLSVSVDDRNEAGVDWNVVYQSLSRGLSLDFSGPFQPAASAGTLGASVVNTGRFSGSNVVVSALSAMGRVRTVTSPSLTTVNLRPAPYQIGRQIGYVASSQISQTQGAGTVGGLTPGSITVGFNMTLTPRLLQGDDEVLLESSFNISALRELRRVTAAGTTIEFPDTDTRLFNNLTRIRNGETLILTGFEQDEMSGNRQGTLSPFAWLLGGGIRSSHSRQVIVVLITPEVTQVAPSFARNAQ